jgi:methionyl-tRNA formyltransferase
MSLYSIILLNNNRSKAYLQTLCAHGFKPQDAVVFSDGNPVMATKQTQICRLNGFRAFFDMQESIYQMLDKEEIQYTIVNDMNPNSKISEKAIASLSANYVLYSGPAGVILKPNIINLGKRIIHAHPGILPQFRGSTTIYYSLLIKGKAGCSVILLDEGIDSGFLLFSKEYQLETGFLDYDTIVDPLVRAETLLEMFEYAQGNISILDTNMQNGKPNTFFIIHPLLKHLAMLKASGVSKTEIQTLLEGKK